MYSVYFLDLIAILTQHNKNVNICIHPEVSD